MNTEDQNCGLLFNINKVKYTDLLELFPADTLTMSEMNIVLDSTKIFEAFRVKYYENVTKEIIDSKLSYNLAAEFFNYVAHYRNFFRKYGVHTVFTLIHGSNDTEKETLIPEWNMKYRSNELHPSTSKFLDFVVESRIKPMAAFLPDIYVVSSAKLDAPTCRTVFPYILNADSKFFAAPTVIISSDPAMMQYIYLFKRTTVLKAQNKSPKRIKVNGIFDEISKDYKTKIEHINDSMLLVHLVMDGTAGIPELNAGVKKRKVLAALETNKEIPERISGKFIYSLFADKLKPVEGIANQEEYFENAIEERLAVLDIPSHALTLTKALKLQVTQQIASEPSKTNAFAMSNKYFGNQINLTHLFN